MYKVEELVTNIPDIATYYDPNLCGSGGMVVGNDNTIWIANYGNDTTKKCVTHYDLYGVQLSNPLPFVDYVSPIPLVPPSQQRQLITDLLWLQKNVLYYRDNYIMAMPKIYEIAPILGLVGRQPSSYQISLNKFLNKPNGYLGSTVDISYLINFCINNPLPLTTPAGRQATKLLSDAHYLIYRKLIIDLFNKDLITQYGNKLSEAQRWIILGARNLSVPENLTVSSTDTMNQIDVVPTTLNDQMPIGLCYNQSRGFVGYQFNGKRVSCDLIGVTASGSIYVYSPLINTGIYYGMFTVLDNSADYAVYTGITMNTNYIYVTDFANRRIDVYDFGWASIRPSELVFNDPNLPDNYSTFNVFAYNSEIYVTYAMVDPNSGPLFNKISVGKGLGIINVFTTEGMLIRRAVTGGELNAPWSIAINRENFTDGRFLVTNHGDGRILYYDSNWNYMGKLSYTNYSKSIIGLYGICMIRDDLYFSSAPNGIVSGMLGKIRKSKRRSRSAEHHSDRHQCALPLIIPVPRPAPVPQPMTITQTPPVTQTSIVKIVSPTWQLSQMI